MELETALAAAEALRAEEVAELEAELEVARGSQAQLLSELEESLTATSAQYEATLKVRCGARGLPPWNCTCAWDAADGVRAQSVQDKAARGGAGRGVRARA